MLGRESICSFDWLYLPQQINPLFSTPWISCLCPLMLVSRDQPSHPYWPGMKIFKWPRAIKSSKSPWRAEDGRRVAPGRRWRWCCRGPTRGRFALPTQLLRQFGDLGPAPFLSSLCVSPAPSLVRQYHAWLWSCSQTMFVPQACIML